MQDAYKNNPLNMKKIFLFLAFFLLLGKPSSTLFARSEAKVSLGIDVLCEKNRLPLLKGKRIGLITNHTAVNKKMQSTIDAIKEHAKICALFAPEHGLYGLEHAEEHVLSSKTHDGIPIFSLYGKNRRPSKDMLKNIDLLIYDIQDIGSRSYTYISTLFYAMEEAKKHHIKIFVLDRPNPLGGLIIDGPMLDENLRSYVGYINIPYCHGMTIGELALFFNQEYQVHCDLKVIPMKGWKRNMTFRDTGLSWIPTSPHIPEDDSPFYYPTTGILGELQIVNIGVGYTLPFKLVGAPWIDAHSFAYHLNAQNFPGVVFHPLHFKPFYGKFKGKNCQGVKIIVNDPYIYKPVSTQYLIIGILKSLYPHKFKEALQNVKHRQKMFSQVNGTEEVYRIMTEKKYVLWPLCEIDKGKRLQFAKTRKKYLLPEYAEN